MSFYAVVQKDGDGPVWGVGRTPEEAWEDAHFWLAQGADLEDDWMADFLCVQCTQELYQEVEKNGGDISWEFVPGHHPAGGPWRTRICHTTNEGGGAH